jgi:hypothetical protein
MIGEDKMIGEGVCKDKLHPLAYLPCLGPDNKDHDHAKYPDVFEGL